MRRAIPTDSLSMSSLAPVLWISRTALLFLLRRMTRIRRFGFLTTTTWRTCLQCSKKSTVKASPSTRWLYGHNHAMTCCIWQYAQIFLSLKDPFQNLLNAKSIFRELQSACFFASFLHLAWCSARKNCRLVQHWPQNSICGLWVSCTWMRMCCACNAREHFFLIASCEFACHHPSSEDI